MAIQTTRTFAQLKKECEFLNLKVDMAGKKLMKEDYIRALREYHLSRMSPVPVSLQRILEIKSPMLCRQIKLLSEEEQKEIWESPYWVFEQKMDGCRMLPVFTVQEGMDYYSRNNSVDNFLPISYKNNLYLKGNPNLLTEDFILDAECICLNPNVSTELEGMVRSRTGVATETVLQAAATLLSLNSTDSIAIQKEMDAPLKLAVFDCLYAKDKWIMDLPLHERRKYTKRYVKMLQDAGYQVELVQSCVSKKKEFYNLLLAAGNEGCIAKNVYGTYQADSNRSRDGWIKIKRTMSQSILMQGLGDYIEGFITGFEPADVLKSFAGLVGTLDISVFLREPDGTLTPHVVARVSNIPLEDRKAMTEIVDGQVKLRQDWYGKVVSIDGQAVSARAKRFRHAIIVQYRDDRTPDTCILDRDFLESMIL